jgi:hypothetical protein
MEFWAYVLGADQREDLASPEAGRAWLTRQRWYAPTTHGEWWTARAAEGWVGNVHTLRSLAKRLKGRRLRHPSIATDLQADVRLHQAVSLFRVTIDRQPAGGPTLSRHNYRGLVIGPSVSTGFPADPERSNMGGGGRRAEPQPPPPQFWLDDCELFWQLVFHSLLTEGGPACCEACGEVLGDTTPTGRPLRRRHCARCRNKVWWAKQPQERKRAKWRADEQKRKKDSSRRR